MLGVQRFINGACLMTGMSKSELGAQMYQKGGIQGVPGSYAHVLTNPKIEDKDACLKEMEKAGVKDTLILGTGAAATLAVAGNAGNIKSAVSSLANKSIKEIASKSAELVKNTVKNPKAALNNAKSFAKTNLNPKTLYNNIKALPTPVKAGLAVAAALGLMVAGQHDGYIEGKNETK